MANNIKEFRVKKFKVNNQEIDLKLNAGHDLNLSNLATLINYGSIEEVSIGHALIVECLDLGLEETIKRYLKILK